jgi:CBS domain-containing protein
MKCPACGHDNLPGADSCDNCAGSLTRDDVPQADSEVERSLMEDPVECLNPVRPITVECPTSLTEAIQLMQNHNIGCVELDQCAVKDFMTEIPETSRIDHPLGYAIHRMVVSDLRYLPIVDETGRSVGIASSRDIIDYMAMKFRVSGES